MRPLRTFALALVVGTAFGCAGGGIRPEVLQNWVGRPAAALEKEWGVPTREVQDGETRILIYEEIEPRRPSRDPFGVQLGKRSELELNRAAQYAEAIPVFRPPTVYVRSYLFWVQRDGTIAHTDVRQP